MADAISPRRYQEYEFQATDKRTNKRTDKQDIAIAVGAL